MLGGKASLMSYCFDRDGISRFFLDTYRKSYKTFSCSYKCMYMLEWEACDESSSRFLAVAQEFNKAFDSERRP